MDECNNDNDAHDDQEEEGAFAPELGTGVGQLGLQSKGEKGGQVEFTTFNLKMGRF